MTEASPVGTPVCYRHPSRETYVRCTRCDRPICPDCMTPASVGHQCPECVAEGRKEQRPVRTAFGATRTGVNGYATIGLIVANALMFIASIISAKKPGAALGGGGLGGLLGGNTPLLTKLSVVGDVGCQNVAGGIPVGPVMHCVYGVSNGEYYRLFTAMFMHVGLIHIGVNMLSLWFLGRPLEAMFGPLRFLGIYLVCGIGGNVACYLFSTETPAAGASTALFGLFGVFFFVLRKLNLSVSTILPIIAINLFITFAGASYISVAGHLGGLVTGAVVGYAMTHLPQARRSQLQATVLVGIVVLLGIAVAWQTHQITSTAIG